MQDSANHGDELLQQSSELSRLQDSVERLQTELLQYKERLKKESAKVKQLEGDKMSESILTEGVTRELEKVSEFLSTVHRGSLIIVLCLNSQHKLFTKRLSKAVNLDSGTAEILSGDFAHDAILTRAEQLAKNEVSQ